MSNELAVIERIQNHIATIMEKGSLDVPAGYSPVNAISEAYLILKETETRDKKPVLNACTPESIDLTFLNMVVMGFYPSRKHCYFIPYGKKLTLMPSYLGKVMLAKRLNHNLREITAEIIYEGDVLEVEIKNGRKTIVFHKQQFKAPTFDVIAGAYAMAVDVNGNVIQTEIMTKAEITTSWKQSKQKPFGDKGELRKGTVHFKFPGEMAKRTVKARLCKTLISSAVEPATMLEEAINEIEIESVEAELENAIAEHAGVISIGFDEEKPEKKPTPKAAPKPRASKRQKPAQKKSPDAAMEIDDSKVTVTQATVEEPPAVEIKPEDDPFGGSTPAPDDIPNEPADPFGDFDENAGF
jgi:recombination protein RecT